MYKLTNYTRELINYATKTHVGDQGILQIKSMEM